MTPEEKGTIPDVIYVGPYGTIGYCSKGRWARWIFFKHPDGQWVSLAKIPPEDNNTPHKSREAELLACIRDLADMVDEPERWKVYADIIKQARGE